MMLQKFSKAVLLVVLGLVSVAPICAYKSHKVQVVLNPSAELWYPGLSFWAINTLAGGISYDFNAAKPLGAYYEAKGLIFKKGTVSKYQADYSVDKHGNPLQASNSLGSWLAADFVMTPFSWLSLPSAGTFLSQGTWSFFFNDNEGHDNLYAVGRQKAGIYGASNGSEVVYGKLSVDGGNGEFHHSDNRPHTVSANWYFSTAGNVLIKIEFDREIEVHS